MRAVTDAMFTIFPREAVSSGSCVNICVIAYLDRELLNLFFVRWKAKETKRSSRFSKTGSIRLVQRRKRRPPKNLINRIKKNLPSLPPPGRCLSGDLEKLPSSKTHDPRGRNPRLVQRTLTANL